MIKYYDVMKEELVPAFGCTEPIALAFASAKAAEVLGEEPDKMIARCSGNIIKNAKSVTIPGTNGQKGIAISCILGAIAGDPSKNLEVLSGIDKSKLNHAKELENSDFFEVELVPGIKELYIQVEVFKGDHQAKVTVHGEHTNIIEIEKDYKVIFEKPLEEENDESFNFSFDAIYDFALNCDIEPIKEVLDRQIEFNSKIAEEGFKDDYGANIGKLNLEKHGDIENKVVSYAASGSDARMAGSEMPVVINSGSGNQGITVSVPIIVYAKEIGATQEELYRALIFSNLLGLYQKQGIGRLSAYCGVVSAASAAVAGIALLNKEPKEVISNTLMNSLAANSGIICDGAKASCAIKIKTSLDTALFSYKQAKTQNSFEDGDGIVKESIDDTIRTVGHIARYGMLQTDVVILNEMINNEEYLDEFKKKN